MASSKISYFCMGLGIGASLGLLFAPRKGDETLAELRQRAGEGREYLKNRGDELRQQAGGMVNRGRGNLSLQREQLAAALAAGRKAYRKAAENPEPQVAGAAAGERTH